ncbi:bcl-2-related ovarian killer protein [Culex quinquefasciatus]|uniref:bcl-2-related ovarian killer protein n=1 Tax=Culex quinquefasciatus TaxID=7176 RepID=UPI0018E2A3E6|nr:bcl-2-related ovarian killer protein [Culex quinquefasciatus]
MSSETPTNKFTNVVGWTNRRSPIHHLTTTQDVINQGKCLCGEYIRARLKRSGLLNRKILQRLRSTMEFVPPSCVVVRESFPVLNGMGEELERMHPRLYTNVSRQISLEPWGELTEPDSVCYLLHVVAKDLFKTDITWGKVISLFAIAGGLAVDCVRQEHYDYLQQLIEGTTDVIEEDLSAWLVEKGGWLGLHDHVHPPQTEITFLGWMTITISTLLVIYLISVLLKHLGSNYLSKF